jgi:alkylation response protein AidB-like acyl-CoA dehydrogenase
MDTGLSEEQALLRDSVRDLLDKEVDFKRIRELEREGQFDEPLWRKLAELGWLGLPFPEALGGGGGTLLDTAIVVEELGYRAAIVPFAEVMIAGLTVARFAPEKLAGDVIDAIGSGRSVLLPAVLGEGDSYQATCPTGTLPARITGRRAFVEYGQFGTSYLVRTLRNGVNRLELVDAGEAISTRPLDTIARMPSAMVDLQGAPSGDAAGEEGYDFLLALGRTLAAVQCLANAQRALDMAVEYVRNRVQFGRPIGTFQAVQHHAANMALLVEATRFLTYEAVWALNEGLATPEQIAVAKAWASRSAVEVTALAHQLHGGIGVTEEYDLHFFSLRAKERAIAWGTPEECVDLVARTIEQLTDWANGPRREAVV